MLDAIEKVVRVVLMSAAIVAIGYGAHTFWQAKPKVSTYNIKQPNNGKFHAIVQIQSVKRKGTCTAFIVREKIAITAAHCISWNKKGKSEKFKVYNINGEYTGVKAQAWWVADRRDIGLIQGDFKAFNRMPLKAEWDVKPYDIMRLCGFFGSVLPPTCNNFIALGNKGFRYAGIGVVIPGVSGGPVIDHRGYAVGVASSVGDREVYMEPLLGILNLIDDEQRQKITQSEKKK